MPLLKDIIRKLPGANFAEAWINCLLKMFIYIKSFPSQLRNYFFVKHFYQRHFSKKHIGVLYNHALGTIIQITELQMRECYARNINLFRDAVWVTGSKPANLQIQKMYERSLPIFTNDELYHALIDGGHRYLRGIHTYIEDNYRNGIVFYPECQPFLSFNDEEIQYGFRLFEKIGIGRNDTFAVMHNKDNFYWKKRTGIDKTWDVYRDSNFSTLIKGIRFLKDQNIKVVRSGHYEDENEYEYYSLNTLSPDEKDFMDIFIQKYCLFSVNGDSGIAHLPYLFKKPVLIHNFIPMGESPVVEGGIIIPKILKEANSEKVLSITEILRKKSWLCYLDRGRFHKQSVSADQFQSISYYQKHGIEIKDNSPDDILDGLKEILAYVKGTLHLSEEQKKMQEKFRTLFPVGHPMRHFIGIVSPSFLEKNKEILK